MEHISQSLEGLLKKLELDRRILGWSVLGMWEEVVGRRIAANAKPVAYRDAKLFVQVATTAWMHELCFMKEEVLKKLSARLGEKVVEDIVFSLAR